MENYPACKELINIIKLLRGKVCFIQASISCDRYSLYYLHIKLITNINDFILPKAFLLLTESPRIKKNMYLLIMWSQMADRYMPLD